MSVPLSKRDLSSLEFYNNIHRFKEPLLATLVIDFGCLDKKKALRRVVKNYTPPAGLNLQEEELLEWLINRFKCTVYESLMNITTEVVLANETHPANAHEYHERRLHQDKAVGYCYVLKENLKMIRTTLGIGLDKYDSYIEMIDYEITLLKGWRSSDYKRYKKKIENI